MLVIVFKKKKPHLRFKLNKLNNTLHLDQEIVVFSSLAYVEIISEAKFTNYLQIVLLNIVNLNPNTRTISKCSYSAILRLHQKQK